MANFFLKDLIWFREAPLISIRFFEAKSLSVRFEIVFCIFLSGNSFSRNILPQLARYIIFRLNEETY